jgi:hypothetical protein
MKNYYILFIFLFIGLKIQAQTYAKNIGVPIMNDGATSICIDNNTLYIAGFQKDAAYFEALDVQGNILWREVYDFTEQFDYIQDIQVINNKLIGCGMGYAEGTANFLEFYFSFDITKKEFDWVKRNTLNVKPATIKAMPNGNYLLTGDEFLLDKFHVFLMEINARDGKTENYASWVFSGNESSSTAIIHDNFIYSGGRYALEKKTDKYRGAISKFDLNFNEIWSNYYLNKKEKFLRNYLTKIIVDDNALISLFFTNNNGVNSYYTACLAKQSLDGELLWATEYSLAGYKSLTVRDIKATADGYYILGYTKDPVEDLFIIKTDKESNVLWAKIYGDTQSEKLGIDQGNFLEVYDNYIYVIGQSKSINTQYDDDSFLMKINLDGSSDISCWSKDAIVKTNYFEELIEGQIFLNREDSTYKTYNIGYTKSKFNETKNSFFCAPKWLNNDTVSISSAADFIIDFLSNDQIPDKKDILISIVENPKNGKALLHKNSLTYQLTNQNECRLDSIKYMVYSALSGNDTATIYLYNALQTEYAKLQKDTILPLNASITLQSSMPNANYIWNTESRNNSITVNKPALYTVNNEVNGCITSEKFNVLENPYSFENVATNNLSFLLDVSLSMNRENRLPILKNALFKIMAFMRSEDKLSVINYSAEPEIIFNGITATQIDLVKTKIDAIIPDGKSNVSSGYQLALKTNIANQVTQANNRIILTTDGDMPNEKRLQLMEALKKSFPADTYFTILLFNDASIYKSQMEELAAIVNGKVYSVTPDNIEQVLLKEFKAIRKN